MLDSYLTGGACYRHASWRATPARWNAPNITFGLDSRQPKISPRSCLKMQKSPPDPGPGGILCILGSDHQVQLIRPFADELQVFVVSECDATAVQPAGGPAIAVAVIVTFCDAVKPCAEPLPEK
jgi:hypothetical protein